MEKMTNQDVAQENKMGVMPVGKLLFNMAMPMIISMLVQALYNIVDSAFVGMYSADGLQAVSTAFPIQNLMIAVATGTGVGMNALLSRHLGEGKNDAASKTACNGVFLSVCSYIVFAVIGLTLMRPYCNIQSDVETVVEYGTEYLTIVTVFGFGLFGEIAFERLLQSTGKTFYSMLTQGAGAITNIILDPILIFGFGPIPSMGVAGAAIATVAGQCVACILGFIFNAKVNHEIKVSIKGIAKPSKMEISKIYAVAIPSIIMSSITSVLTFGMNLILKTFSEDAITVYGVYFKLNSFIFMPIFGLNNGLVPILAYNYGARKFDRIRRAIKLSMISAVAYMIFGFVIFELFPEQLLNIFSVKAEVMAIGLVALRIIGTSFIFAGVSIISSTVFQAIGNPMHSLAMSVFRQLVIILPVAFALSLLGKVDYVWFSYPIAEAFAFVFSVVFLSKTLKKLSKMEHNAAIAT